MISFARYRIFTCPKWHIGIFRRLHETTLAIGPLRITRWQ